MVILRLILSVLMVYFTADCFVNLSQCNAALKSLLLKDEGIKNYLELDNKHAFCQKECRRNKWLENGHINWSYITKLK